MKKIVRKIVSLLLILGIVLSMLPIQDIKAEAAVSAGINDMTALDALGIDISKAPPGYDPNTTDNPFGREITSLAVVDELFIAGRSTDRIGNEYTSYKNYSKLYGDNWATGGTIDSFFNASPSTLGSITNGITDVFQPDIYNKDAIGARALNMVEANFDVTKKNSGRKDGVAYAAYNVYAPNPREQTPNLIFGYINPRFNQDTQVHATTYQILNSGVSIGNNEDKSGAYEFKNEYLASAYLKIAAGDYDGDGVDEVAVYVPSIDNPRVEVYKVSGEWTTGYAMNRTMIFQLDRYKATRAVGGNVPTNVGDTLIPNVVSLVSGDFDMDGIDDLAISYGYTGSAMDSAPSKAFMVFGEKAGNFGSRTQDIPLNYKGVAVVRASFATGDVDGDEKKELVVGGSIASAKFNPNERYVAIYKWNGSSFSVSQSKKFDIFEKDSNGSYVNTNIPDSKTTYHSLAFAPTNITIGHFNGISEPVNIYVDSILIELGDNGMEIAAVLDDNLKTDSSNDYVEWGARAAQLTGNGTDTLITMTSDVASSSPVPNRNFIQYFNDIINKLKNPAGEKTYIAALYGTDNGLKRWRSEEKGASFCLPNTDNDSSTVRYTGEHYYTYIDPEILAVLASPPYFKDLFNDEVGGNIEPSATSYGTSKGSGGGQSYSNTLSVGLYTSYEKSVTLFGVELFKYEAELEINNHMTWETLNTSMVEQSVTYETLSGQDTVVFFSLPIETYVYEQTYPVTDKGGNFIEYETQSMTVNIPHEASVRNLPLETYERIAADYDELPKISGTVLRHTLGVPSTYPGSVKGYGSVDLFGRSGLPTLVSSGDPAKVGYGASSQTKEIAMTKETENSFNYELDISTKIGVGGGGLMVGITAGYAHGAGTVSITTEGSTYSGTVYALPTEAEAYGYDFNWKLFTYPYIDGDTVFPVVSYIVSDITQPPMLPDNFAQLDEGTTEDSVALTWQHSGNPAGFTIYRYFRAAGSAGFYEVKYIPAGDMDYIVETDGTTRTYKYIDTGLSPDTEYLYKIQTVGNTQPGLSIQSETLTTYTKPEGIIPEVNISADELTIYPDTEHIASVSIKNADMLSGSTLFFQWQKFDSELKKWTDLATLNSTSIRFTDAGLDDEGLYRCKVTSRQNTTIVSSYSPILNVVYSKRTAVMSELEAERSGDSGTLSVKLTGSGTKTIPSGTVVFKLEAEGYLKQYAATINTQGVASVAISTVPGVYKVTADYNGNRVFKPSSIDKDNNGNGVFYVYGQGTGSTSYWDYADIYTYGDSIKFTKYNMDMTGNVTGTETIDFSDSIGNGKNLWRKMELYNLPDYNPDNPPNVLLYEPKEYNGNNLYRPLVCNETNETDNCTHGVENVLGEYLDSVIDRFKSGKAGWVGDYYIPHDLNSDGVISGYDAAETAEIFNYSTSDNPEGFYFTIGKAKLNVDFKDGYQDLVRSVSEIELYGDYKEVVLTEDNYKDFGFTAGEWEKFMDVKIWQIGTQRELLIAGEFVLCQYNLLYAYDKENQCKLEYRHLFPSGPGALLSRNENALTATGRLFNDNPLETVVATDIKDTGMFDRGYKIASNTRGYETPFRTFYDERLFTYPANLWAFEGHYFEIDYYEGTEAEGSMSPVTVGYEESPDRPMDNFYPEHGLNIFRYDRFGNRFPITKYDGEYPKTQGQFTLGVEPTYYLNIYKANENVNLAYPMAHVAGNYDITFGKASMTVTGTAYSVSCKPDDVTKGSVALVVPSTGTSKKYPVGTELIFVATPNEGFEVDRWEAKGIFSTTVWDEKEQTGGTQFKVTQNNRNMEVTVYFKVKSNTLTYMTEPESAYVNGEPVENKITCSIPSGKELMAGADINMSANAVEGWHFVKWEVHTEGAATQYVDGNSLSRKMPNTSIRIYGVFGRDSYKLTLGENLVAYSDDKVLDTSRPIAGDTLITVKSAIGCELAGDWSVTEGVTDIDQDDNTFTFRLLKDTMISADTTSGTYEVTILDSVNGDITVSGAEDLEKVKGGTILKFTATPERGYKVSNWSVNGQPIINNSNTLNYTLDDDIEVSVEFMKKDKKTIYVSVADGSQAKLKYTIDDVDYTDESSNGSVELYENETLVILAIPNANEMVAGWSINGNYNQSYSNFYEIRYADNVNSVKVYTQSMFNNKIEFAAVYEGSESSVSIPILKATSDGINIVSGSSIGAGREITFKLSANDEVSISRWTIAYGGGAETDILDENSRIFIDKVLTIPYTENDTKVTVYYVLNSELSVKYTLTVVNGIGGGEYGEDEEVEIIAAEPEDGMEFVEWDIDPTVIFVRGYSENNAATRFIMPASDLVAKAKYKETEESQTTYTITFNGNDVEISPSAMETDVSGKLESLPAPEREEYEFLGWYTQASGGEKITTETVFTKDTEIFAHWTEREIEITITDVTVSPTEADVQRDTTRTFTATVTGTGEYDDTVTWSIEGANSSETSINQLGKLIVAVDETATEITVIATSKEDSNKKGTATVRVTDEPVTKYYLTVVSGSGSGEYAVDDEIIIIADKPESGREFNRWKVISGTLHLGDSTANPLTFRMPDEDIEIEATYRDIVIAPELYNVTVRGSYAPVTGEGKYEQGETVYIYGGSRNNYSFDGWTSSDVTILNASNKNARFTMPAKNITVIANWTYNDGGGSSGSGGSGGDGNGGGGSGEGGSSSDQDKGKKQEPVQTPSKITANITGGNLNGTGTAVEIDTNVGNARISLANMAEKSFIGEGKTTISIPFIDDIRSCTTELPVDLLTAEQEKGDLIFKTQFGNVEVPGNMLAGIGGYKGKTASITIGAGNKSYIPFNVSQVVGNHPLISLELTIDGKQINPDNFNAPVVVSIPYIPTIEELLNQESIIIWYIDGGKLSSVPNGCYDPKTGMVTFTTTHFSYYAVGYNKITFSDVANDSWYEKAIAFISARNITSGTGDNKFSPDAPLTRGQFITLLLKALEVNGSENFTNNFADAGNTYYTNYLAEAKRLSITQGIGNNLFAPEKEITRQEMFTMLYNSLKITNKLPKRVTEKTLLDFSDGMDVALYAQDAMNYLLKANVISGSNNKLTPMNTTTRAEIAQILYNLMGNMSVLSY